MTSQPSILELGTSSGQHLIEGRLFILSTRAANSLYTFIWLYYSLQKYHNEILGVSYTLEIIIY